MTGGPGLPPLPEVAFGGERIPWLRVPYRWLVEAVEHETVEGKPISAGQREDLVELVRTGRIGARR